MKRYATSDTAVTRAKRLVFLAQRNGTSAVAPLTTESIPEFSPAGERVRAVKMPQGSPTNMCCDGVNMQTAYITLSDTGRFGMMQWHEPGLTRHVG